MRSQPPTYQESLNALSSGLFAQWPRKIQETALKTPNGKSRHTVLHEAALLGILQKIPNAHLNDTTLCRSNQNSHTPVHLAATNGHLNQFPKGALTKKNLLKTNLLGQNSLHKAAQWDHLDQIPPEFLTEENLLLPDNNGDSPLSWYSLPKTLKKLHEKIPHATLKALLKNPKTPAGPREWIKREIKNLEKENLRKILADTQHPCL